MVSMLAKSKLEILKKRQEEAGTSESREVRQEFRNLFGLHEVFRSFRALLLESRPAQAKCTHEELLVATKRTWEGTTIAVEKYWQRKCIYYARHENQTDNYTEHVQLILLIMNLDTAQTKHSQGAL